MGSSSRVRPAHVVNQTMPVEQTELNANLKGRPAQMKKYAKE